MTTGTVNASVELPCHGCGYDLRAHPQDGQCPECGASVESARRFAAIPRRPAWRDSDPRWRRRMLAGTWILVLVPLAGALRALGWSSRVPLPDVFGFPGTVRTLDETLLYTMNVYPALAFCIGMVLLFSTERGRRRGPLDWTRRWGVLCSYVVFLLCAAQVLFLASLVLVGIGALLQGMPPELQPALTGLLVNVSTSYLRYGPQPTNTANVVLVAFSSITVLLACAPLFDALRSSGPRRYAAILLAPLALFSLMHLAQAGRHYLRLWGPPSSDVFNYETFFSPQLLVAHIANPARVTLSGSTPGDLLVEVVKWCAVLGIAIWLTAAHLAPRRSRS